MSDNQYSVDELVVQLHLNIDNINQIVHSISCDSYNQELDQLTAERESAIHSLREKRVEALKEILAQRSREREEIENKRLRERKLIEEKRVQEWEEILARRRREDEEWQKTIDTEDEITEKSRKAEDEEREREREEEERFFFEESQKEVDKLEKNAEKRLDERKFKLKKLDEERKVINAQIETAISAISVVPNIVFCKRLFQKEKVCHHDSHEELNKNLEVVTPVFTPKTSESYLESKGADDYHPPALRAHSKSLTHIRDSKIGKDFSFVPYHKKSRSNEKISRYTPLLTSSEPKELRLVTIIQKEMSEQAMKKNESILFQKKIPPKLAIRRKTRDAGTKMPKELINDLLGSSTTILPGENHASFFKEEHLNKEDLRNLDSKSPFNSVHDIKFTIPHPSLDDEKGSETYSPTWLDTKSENESKFEISSQSLEITDPSLDQKEKYDSKVEDTIHFSLHEFQEKQLSAEAISDIQNSNEKLPSFDELHTENYPLILKSQLSIAEQDPTGKSIRSDPSTVSSENLSGEIDADLNTYSPKELLNSSELKSHTLHEKKWVSESTVSKITEDRSENQSGKPLLDSILVSDKFLESENGLTTGELIQSNKCSDLNQDLISNTNLKSEKEPTHDNSDVPSITEVSETDIISEHAHLDQPFQVSDVSVLGQDVQFKHDGEKNEDNGTNLILESSGVSGTYKEKIDQPLDYSHSTEDLETTKNTKIESTAQSYRETQRQDSFFQLNESDQLNFDRISHEQVSIDNQEKIPTSKIDQSLEMSFKPNDKTSFGEQVDTKTTNFTSDASINLEEDQSSETSVHDLIIGSKMINSINNAEIDYSGRCDRSVAMLSDEIISIDIGEQDRFTKSEMTTSDVPTKNQTISSIKTIEASIISGRIFSSEATISNLPRETQNIETENNLQANLGGNSESIKILDENKTIAMRSYDMRYRKNISRDLAALKYFNTNLISEPNHPSNAQPSIRLGIPVSLHEESNMKSSLTTSTNKTISSGIFTEEIEVIQEDITPEHLGLQNFQNQDNFDRSTDIKGQNFCPTSQICQNSDCSSTLETLKNKEDVYFDISSKAKSHITVNLDLETSDIEEEVNFLTPCLTIDEKSSHRVENQLHVERSEIINQESENKTKSLSVEFLEKSQDDYQSITMTAEENNRSSHLGSIETVSSSESISQISSPTAKIASEIAQSYSYSKIKDSNIRMSFSDPTSDSREKSRNCEDSTEYFKNSDSKDNYNNELPISIDEISESEKNSFRDYIDEKYEITEYQLNKNEHQSRRSDTSEMNDKIERVIQNIIEDENVGNLSEPPIKDDSAKKSEQTHEGISLTIFNKNSDLEKNSITDFISENTSRDLDLETLSESSRESVDLELELETDSKQQGHFQDDNLENQIDLSRNSSKIDNKRTLSLGVGNISEEKVEDSLPISDCSNGKSILNSYMDSVPSPEYQNLTGNTMSQKIPSDVFMEAVQNLELSAKTDPTILRESQSTFINQNNDEFHYLSQMDHPSAALQPTTDSYPEIMSPSNRTKSPQVIKSKGSVFHKALALFEYQEQQKQQNDQGKKNTIRPLSGILNRRNIYKNPQGRSLSLSSTFFSTPQFSEDKEASISPNKISDNINRTHGTLLNTSSSAPLYSEYNKRSQRAEQSRISFFEQLQYASDINPLSPLSGVISPVSCSQRSEY